MIYIYVPRDAVCSASGTLSGRRKPIMVKGLGLDLCEIARMDRMMTDERFMKRYFTENEIAYIHSKGKGAAQTLAGIFAAKEALAKALGTGITFDLKEISVSHDNAGKPFYLLSGKAEMIGNGDSFLLSISHDGGTAAAVCIREGRQETEQMTGGTCEK
jgi:holo-[acyl-carrier protein] synthase